MTKGKTTKWQQYETEKRRLQAMNLSPQEYEKALRHAAAKLGV